MPPFDDLRPGRWERPHADGGAGQPGDPRAEAEEVPTTQGDAAEPAGDQDASNEADRIADAAPSDDGTPPPAKEDELTAARREREEYLTLAQRTQADFENYRKRAARDAAAAGERAKSGLVRELLPVVDNLERALDSTTVAAERGDRPEEHLADGVRLVHSEMISVLARNGVEPFDPRGEKFDPESHEALSTRPDDGTEAGVVLDVVEKGYRLNGTVLRPARVVVCG